VVGGFGAGFINPVLGAIMLERIPRHLVGRVGSLSDAVCWAGIPLGGVSAGAAIALVGLAPALAVAGGLYFLTTLLPGLRPEWGEMDQRRGQRSPTQSMAQNVSG
jgi:MFS family permease